MTDDQPPAEQPYGEQPQQPANPYQPEQPFQYGGPGHPGGYPVYGGAVSPDDRNWASAAHWGAFVAGFFALAFLAPLVVMLAKGPQSPFVRRHAVESLNFQISLLIYTLVGGIVGVLLILVTFGLGLLVVIPLAIAAFVAVVVVMIQASIKAANGEDYRYPLTLRLVS